MKRWALGLPLACTCLLAHGQSSVTLYGVIDAGLQYANNVQTAVPGGRPHGASQFALTDGNFTGLSGSRWGLRGAEDLGGGLKAIFVLENGFNINTGTLAQGGAEFGRQSYVGISSPYGSGVAGRMYDPYVDFVQPFGANANFAGFPGSHPNDFDNLNNSGRINNAIKFTTAKFGGLSAGVMYSLGGVAGNFTQNQIWGLGVGYEGGGLRVGAGYLNARDPNVSFYGNTPNKGGATVNNIGSFGSATSPQSNPVFAGYASAKTLQLAAIAAAYTISSTTVGLVLTDTRFEHLGSSAGPNPLGYTGNAEFVSAEINASVRVTPAWLIGAAFDYTRRNSVNDDGGARYLQIDLGTVYSLSKRTDLYAVVVAQHATGIDSLHQAAVANISGFGPSSTDKQLGARIGIRHKF
ncbi:MAG TPA: porin [Paraburkholderia sp.]